MGALSTSEGVPTGGVYGFAAIAMELIKRLSPDKVVVAWDKAHTSTAQRTKIYPEYKAGRVKPPEDFYKQIPLLKELVEALGWSFVERDNYEADDIIGTLARQVTEMNRAAVQETATQNGNVATWEMIIISSDLDMLQVVDEQVKMYRLLKGFTELEEMDIPAVEAKYGILQRQFLDLKALKGDASDNIPGVPGIGEKGAVKLLNQYGTLEGIYEHIEEIGGATGKKLREGRDSALMSKQLATIMTDAPVQLTELADWQLDGAKVRAALEKLEFRSLIQKFGQALGAGQGVKTATETSVKVTEAEQKALEDLILARDVKELMHRNSTKAAEILAGKPFYDLGQGRFLLNPLARRSEETQTSLFADDPAELRQEYWQQQEILAKAPRVKAVLEELDLPMIPVLYKIEQKGMKIDRGYFGRLEQEYRAEVGQLEEEIATLAGTRFNVNSTMQLSEVLFGKLGLPTRGIKKTQKGYSTGAKELEKLKGLHPIIEKIVRHREAAKLLSTYILPLPSLADGQDRIHTTFTQNVTATGRLSSLNPNLQNIPTRTEEGKRIRKGFIVDAGKKLISVDYAQFELRLAAALAKDENLIQDFNEGIDIHKKTAAEVFGVDMEQVSAEQRRAAKVVNFGIIYGMSPKGLSEAMGMSFVAAKNFIDRYMEVRRPIAEKMQEYLRQARERGYVETYFGRRRPTPDVKSSNFIVRSGAERAAQNMPIQGTEADLMKKAMILLDKKLSQGAEMVMQVHDSIMVEVEEARAEETAQLVKETMEGICPELGVKLVADVKIGQNWGEV